MLPTAQRSSRGHVAEELLLRMFQQRLWAMLPLRVKFVGERPCCLLPNGKCRSWCYVAQCSKAMLLLRVTFMGEGHVAHFPMESARGKSWCHVAQCLKKLQGPCCHELLLRMFQQRLWAMLPLRVKFMDERPCCLLPNGKCRSLCMSRRFYFEGSSSDSSPCCP